MLQWIHMQTHEHITLHNEPTKTWFTIQTAIILGSIIVGVSVLLAGASSSTIKTAKPSAAAEQAAKKPIVAPVTKNDLIFGDANAPITIVEYSDIECPFCNRFHATMNEVLEKYDGKVKYVFRHFPLNFHPNAPLYAEAVECVYADLGKEKAFKVLNALFTTQPLQKITSGQAQVLGTFIGSQIQADATAITACLTSGRFSAKVTSDTASGSIAGVSGTPSAFIMNKKGDIQTVSGAQPFPAVQALIEASLK